MNIVTGGNNICGISIGVLSLESYFPKPPGHIKNPSSLPFTTSYEILTGISVPDLLYNPTPEMEAQIVDAARRLEQQGVKAITGSCGFLAIYQQAIVEAVSIPVFVSSLIQIPLAYQMTGKTVGVITADSRSLTDRHLQGVAVKREHIAVAGLEHTEEFARVILRNETNNMDMDIVTDEVISTAKKLLQDNPQIGSIVLECTDLPPYAHELQAQLGVPIFDLTTLATMVHDVVVRQPFKGFV